ncbi:hypothetical protein MKX34_24115 [Paenibacillus sp. FSL R5-0636]|nr:hypothetical protein [Paenibacillus odorifer]
MTQLTNEEIREINLWLYDNPRYQALSWRDAVAVFQEKRKNENVRAA